MPQGPPLPYERTPGWYADPRDPDSLRYWDGGRWTEESKAAVTAAAASQPAADRSVGQSRTAAPGHARRPAPVLGGLSRQERLSATRADPLLARADSPLLARTERLSAIPSSGRAANEGPDQDLVEADRADGADRVALSFSALFVLSLLLFAAGFAVGSEVVRVLALTGAVFFGVGTAPLQLSRRASLDLRLCVAGIAGLSVPVIVAGIMALAPIWHPTAAAIVVGLAALVVHVEACRRALPVLRQTGLRLSLPRAREVFDSSVICSLLGTLLWLAGLAATGHVVPGVLGFLPKAPFYWYAGLVLLVAGIVLARGKSELRAALGVISLLAALTLTPSAVYGMPRSASAAKHIDIVQGILQTHTVSGDLGIYQAYSGFFSAIAWLCNVSGMHDIIGVATYFPFFIDIVAVAALRFVFGQLTKSTYRIWVSLMLVVLVNSIGADYFSPQALGFSLGMGIFGLALIQPNTAPGLSERGRLGILLTAGCALAITHELSPYMVGGVLLILVVFRLIRPWYAPALILVPAAVWALLHESELSGFISLSSLGNLGNFEPPKQGNVFTTPGLTRLPIVGESSDALLLGILILIVIAAIGFIRNYRSRASWAFMMSPAVGLVLIAINPYGNEGIFRAVLFAIPWLAAVGTQAVPVQRARWSSLAYGIISVGLIGTYLVSMFGLDNANVMRPSDYQAVLTYQAKASPSESYLLNLSYGDEVIPVAVDFPALTAYNHVVSWSTLVTQAEAAIKDPTVADANAMARQYFDYAEKNDGETGQLYGVWALASAEYSQDYGLETYAQAVAWRDAIAASPDWQVVSSHDGSLLVRVSPRVSAHG